MSARVSACRLRAILVSVSPRATCTVAGFAEAAASGGGAAEETLGAAASGAGVSAGAGWDLGACCLRLLRGVAAVEGAPPVEGAAVEAGGGGKGTAAGGAAAVVGAVTGAAAFGF